MPVSPTTSSSCCDHLFACGAPEAVKDAYWLKWARHCAAGVVHILSASTILIIGLAERPLKEYNLNIKRSGNRVVWQYVCYADGVYTNDIECSTENKAFYSDGLRGSSDTALLSFNVLFWAFFFAAWSGTMHIYVAVKLWRAKPRLEDVTALERKIRWRDYSVSAPLMLAVVGASFGAANVHAVVAAPLGLCLLMVAGGTLEEVRVAPLGPPRKPERETHAKYDARAPTKWHQAARACATIFSHSMFLCGIR